MSQPKTSTYNTAADQARLDRGPSTPYPRTIHVHRDNQHVAAISCDPQAIGWVVADDVEPFTIKPGDQIDMAITYKPSQEVG